MRVKKQPKKGGLQVRQSQEGRKKRLTGEEGGFKKHAATGRAQSECWDIPHQSRDPKVENYCPSERSHLRSQPWGRELDKGGKGRIVRGMKDSKKQKPKQNRTALQWA